MMDMIFDLPGRDSGHMKLGETCFGMAFWMILLERGQAHWGSSNEHGDRLRDIRAARKHQRRTHAGNCMCAHASLYRFAFGVGRQVDFDRILPFNP